MLIREVVRILVGKQARAQAQQQRQELLIRRRKPGLVRVHDKMRGG